MQTRRFLAGMLVLGTVLLASCSSSNKEGRYIPKSAALVVHVDGKDLSAKLPWDSVKTNPFLQDVLGDSSIPAVMKSLLDNPENTGIDTKNDLLFYAVKDSVGAYAAFQGTVKDEAKFEAFHKNFAATAAIEKKDGFSTINLKEVVGAWKDGKFIYVVDAPQFAKLDEITKGLMDGMNDSADAVQAMQPRDLKATALSVLNIKEDASLAEEKKFTTLVEDAGEIHFWMNAEELNKGMATNPAMAMFNLDKLYKGAITTATLLFDNGKISLKSRSYASKELTDIYKKYSGGNVNEDMLKSIAGKDPVALFALNYKPAGLPELIKLTNLDGLLNIGLAALGFTTEDFVKANKGDLVFGVTDFTTPKPDTTGGMSPFPKPDFNMVFGVSIGEAAAFDKLMAAAKKATANDWDSSFASIAKNDKFFAISNKQTVANDFVAGKANPNMEAAIKKIAGNSFGGYFNIKALLKGFEAEATRDSVGKVIYDLSMKTWEDVIMTSGGMDGDAMVQLVEINLSEKNTNSLLQLSRYINTISAVAKEDRKRRQEAYNQMEEEVTAPVVEEVKN